MKTWVNFCAIVLAAGVVTVSAQTTAGTPANTNEAVAPPPAPAPVPAPAPPKVTAPPRTPTAPAPAPENHKAAVTNPPPAPPPPAPVEEVKPPEAEPDMPTNVVPAEGEGTATAPPANAAPPAEGSGLGHLGTLLIGVVILLVGGGVGYFIWSKANVAAHGSLITSAMNELKKNPPSEDKEEEKPEEKKKLEIKFPPPMT
jgi:hypothetical protein